MSTSSASLHPHPVRRIFLLGSVGADKVAKAAPDGYTLLMGHIGTLAVNPLIYPKLGYDPIKSFVPWPGWRVCPTGVRRRLSPIWSQDKPSSC